MVLNTDNITNACNFIANKCVSRLSICIKHAYSSMYVGFQLIESKSIDALKASRFVSTVCTYVSTVLITVNSSMQIIGF